MLKRTLSRAAQSTALERTVTTNRILSRAAHRFIAGEGLDEAVAAATYLSTLGIAGILDLVGEGVTDSAGAQAATDEYVSAAEAIEAHGLDATISIKLSQLGQTVDRDLCVENLMRILDRSSELDVRVEIDMEDSSLVADTLALYREAKNRNSQVRVAIQAALRCTPQDLQAMSDLKPRIRLVKGAYDEPIELAQRDKRGVTAQYKILADWLFAHGDDPAFGTHDGELIDHVRETARRLGKGQQEFEIQMLYGVRRDLQERLAREGYRVRVYIPYGSSWYPYFVRRLAERPANLQFLIRAFLGR